MDRLYRQLAGRIQAGSDETELADEETVRLSSTTAAVPTKAHGALELVYQAAEVINIIEDQANETEKTLTSEIGACGKAN
jgi:hypothetical protein